MADNKNTEYLAYNIIQKMYYPTEIENKDNEEYILNKYSIEDSSLIFGEGNVTTSNYSYIEMPDRLTNINGAHIYKLISSKDIDWENVLLKYSEVPSTNWGDFDEQRRWSNTDNGKAITINDVYELMNVIDYLLCSCENLWDEINKLKYNKQVDKLLFYVINAFDSSVLAADSNHINDPSKIDAYITYLDPYNDYTLLTNELQNFGMATEIYHDTAKYMIYFVQEGKGQIIPGITLSDTKKYSLTPSSNKNKSGILTVIYGNKLYNEIRLYPSANIYNFINNRKYPLDNIIDFENKKFKFETVYCIDYKYNNYENNDIPFFREVYIDFYRSSDNSEYNNYIIYYIDSDIKYVIYNSGNNMPNNPYDYIYNGDTYNTSRIEDYIYNDDNILSPLQKKSIWDENTGQICLYTISDNYTAKFRVSTQGNISSIPTMTIDINLNYYKRPNEITSNIYIKESNDEETEVIPIVDMNEENNILYNNTQKRYNVPSDLDIIVKTNASYLDTNNNKLGNDNRLILNSIYEDIMLYKLSDNLYVDQFNNIIDNSQNLYSISVSPSKELQFTQKSVEDYGNLTKLNDINNKEFAIVYKKIENPYKLSYSLELNSYLLQEELNYGKCQQIINNIKNSIIYDEITSKLKFSYDLKDLEQIKFNLKLSIDETPKVKGISYTLPINLNKIYKPTINFISHSLINEEFKNYNENNTYKKILLSNDTRNNINNNPLEDRYDYYNEINNTYYKLLSKIFTYEYNNKNEKYTDIIKLRYRNSDSVDYDHLSYNTELTYNMNYPNDSNYENTYFISYFDTSYSYISLLGSYFTRKVLPTNTYLTYFTYLDNYSSSDNNSYAYYMFNIYNLSSNYRPKGGDNFWMIDYDSLPAVATTFEANRKTTYYNSYANCVKNNLNNLTYFINVNIYNNGHEQTYKENEYSNIIKTNSFEIIKDQYKLYNFKEEMGANSSQSFNANNYSISYIPILSMHLIKSTFNPGIAPSNYIDNVAYFNLNNQDDLLNYQNFINIWDSSIETNNTLNKYLTSTITLQLNQNRTRDLPFFEQSNTAQTNIKILRHNPSSEDITTTNLSIQSLFNNNSDKILYFDINKKYYFADLYNISTNNKNVAIGCIPYSIKINNKNTDEYQEFFTHTSSVTVLNENNNTYILKYLLEDQNGNIDSSNENLYKCNKFALNSNNPNETFLKFSTSESASQINIPTIFNYYSNKSYFDIDLNKINNSEILSNPNNETSLKILFGISSPNSGVKVGGIGLGGIYSNFRFLNYDLNTSSGTQNISDILIKLLSREKNNTINIQDYNSTTVNINNYEYTIEFFKYIDIQLNTTNNINNDYFEIIKEINGTNTTIKYKNLSKDIVYQNLDEFEKYKYQVKLFLSYPNNFLCMLDYIQTNNYDNPENAEDITNTSDENRE